MPTPCGGGALLAAVLHSAGWDYGSSGGVITVAGRSSDSSGRFIVSAVIVAVRKGDNSSSESGTW